MNTLQPLFIAVMPLRLKNNTEYSIVLILRKSLHFSVYRSCADLLSFICSISCYLQFRKKREKMEDSLGLFTGLFVVCNHVQI